MTIVSFQHNFIFFKTTKTAGTSIEVDLSKIAGDDAVVTPIVPPEPGHLPRNYRDPDGEDLFSNHMRAALVRKQLGPKVFDSMFKFCVEREPIQKCISQFHMLRNSPLHSKNGAFDLSWDDYVRVGKFPLDTGKYSIKKQKVVDRILRYDQLPGALETLMTELGVADFKLTARAKSSYSNNVLITHSEVSAEQRKIIYDRFRESLKISEIDWETTTQIDEERPLAKSSDQTP